MEASDRQLLDRYTAGGDETAFRVLVERHLGLVHGVALRVTRNEQLAKDVAQQTFIRLASRAAMIPADLPLPVWLHRVCRHLAIDLVRAEERRKQRELASLHSMNDDPEPAWSSLAPVVDQLVNDLPAADRSVLVLRFYCDQPHASIASQLGVSEAVARKRASRALERLRGMLAKRGIATSSAALATLLPAHAAAPVPPALAASVLKASQGIALLSPTPLQAAALAMNATQKSTIAAAALIFLMSAGYSVLASQQKEAAAASSSSVIAADGSAASRPERSRTERKMPATTAERLEWLQQILNIESSARRQRELIAFIDLLRPAQYHEIGDYLAARNKELYTSVDEYHLLLAAWTKIDAQGALEHVGDGNLYHLGCVLQNWAVQDPDAALAWAEAHPSGTKANLALGYVLGGIAATDMKKAVDLVKAIPDENQRDEALLNLWSNVQDQADVMSRLLPLVDDPELRDRLVERYASFGSREQPGKVLSLLLTHPNVGSPKKIAEIFENWARESPTGARVWLRNLPPGEIRERSVMSVCQITAMKEPAKAFALLDRYPETATDHGVAQLAPAIILYDPPRSLDRIMGIRDVALREATLLKALRNLEKHDAAAAEAWVSRNSLPESVRQELHKTPAE